MNSERRQQQQRYIEEVGKAMIAFQMIEETLKNQIDIRYQIIRSLVSGMFPFNYGNKDLENASMERLISIYKKMSDNEVLIKKIQSLLIDRNHCAHRALAIGFIESLKDDSLYARETNRIIEIAERAWDCFKQLIEETNRMSMHLEQQLDELANK